MAKKDKRECSADNLLRAYKARDFERIAQSHEAWLRRETGKGDHLLEVYEVEDGELRVPWAAHKGEVSIGVRKGFVRRLIQFGLLALPLTSVVAACLLLGR